MKALARFLSLFSPLATLAQAKALDTIKIEQIIGLKGALNTNSLEVIDLAIQHRAVNDSMRKTGSTLLVQHPVLGRLPANAALHA